MEELKREFFENLAHENNFSDVANILEPIAHLRNMAVNDPDAVLEILKNTKVKHEAANESFYEYLHEINLIKEIKSGKD